MHWAAHYLFAVGSAGLFCSDEAVGLPVPSISTEILTCNMCCVYVSVMWLFCMRLRFRLWRPVAHSHSRSQRVESVLPTVPSLHSGAISLASIPILEQRMLARRPEYQRVIDTVPALIPFTKF